MYERYADLAFEAEYTYTGADLGSVWTPDATYFRLWAPTAEEVTINLYQSGEPYAQDLMGQLRMQKDINGTWVAAKEGNCSGLYYTYLVMVDGQMNEACDPYARAVGINGVRAMVVDLPATNPAGWDQDRNPNAGKNITDAVIYELHVRDYSMGKFSRMTNKGKFLAFTNSGIKTKGGKPIGLEHIQNLGVTHLHLLPVFDFGYTDESRRSPQYNWGYDPVNFNVPEGSYSTDPHHGEVRIREMKQMVKSIHDAGISVVMDVVYNHVYDAGSFCFNKIVPGYFSRIGSDGTYSNGSFCGNDTASERAMVRKYIVDSVNYWADEYHIDGFRFDLVGLLDVVTIQEIVRTVHQRHPDVIFYGEGWSMQTTPTKPGIALAVQGNSFQLPGFSFFSDTIRDLLRGSTFYQDALGFASGALCAKSELEASFMGMPSWAAQPYQCVNYVSCHDNHTLFDRLSLSAPEAPRDVRIRMNNLAAAFCLLSQGVPFFQAGEELLRTKPGKKGQFDDNSYRSPDRVNALHWEDLDKPEYAQTADYYRGLIALRKAHPVLRLMTRDEVCAKVHPIGCGNGHVVGFYLDDQAEELLIVFNADTSETTLPLPEGPWHVNVRDQEAGTESLDILRDSAVIAPISTLVLSRKKPVDVVAALIWEKDKFLICQRPANKSRGLLWEFVGGKVEPGETMQQALVRECAEELAITVEVGNQFMQVMHEYPDMLIRLTLFHCTIPSGFPQALEHNALCWIHPSQADNYPFCPADTGIVQEVKRIYGKNPPL